MEEETKKEGDVPALPKEEKANLEPANEEIEQNLVEEAKKAALEMKEGLEERRKILEREEKLIARQEALRQLGGGSPAGKRTEKKEETPKEYKDRIEKGEI